mgnify:FL=1
MQGIRGGTGADHPRQYGAAESLLGCGRFAANASGRSGNNDADGKQAECATADAVTGDRSAAADHYDGNTFTATAGAGARRCASECRKALDYPGSDWRRDRSGARRMDVHSRRWPICRTRRCRTHRGTILCTTKPAFKWNPPIFFGARGSSGYSDNTTQRSCGRGKSAFGIEYSSECIRKRAGRTAFCISFHSD